MFSLFRNIWGWLSSHFEGRPRSGDVLLWLLRGVFGVILVGVAAIAFVNIPEPGKDEIDLRVIAFSGILGLGFLLVLTDILIRNKQITTISAIYVGLLLGLLLGNILSTALEPFIFEWDTNKTDSRQAYAFEIEPGTKDKDKDKPTEAFSPAGRACYASPGQSQRKALVALLITVLCCYLSISTLLQTKDEFRFIIPYVEFSKQIKGSKPLVLDTSVIIDGRIADICDTRFIDTKLIVPRFVLQELQSVADSSDKLKRNRGRRGLDMLKRMQNNNKIELVMHDANLPELREVQKVDERLVVLAKVLGPRRHQRLQPEQDRPAAGRRSDQPQRIVQRPEVGRSARRGDECPAGQGRRPDRPGRRLSRRRHHGRRRAGALRHRPGSADHGDERAADARGTNDLRTDRSPTASQATSRAPAQPV